MMVVFCIFLAFPRIVIIIVVAIEFENTFNIIAITTSVPPKIAMHHSACIGFRTRANDIVISISLCNLLPHFYFIPVDDPSMAIPYSDAGNAINNHRAAIIYHRSYSVITIVAPIYIAELYIF